MFKIALFDDAKVLSSVIIVVMKICMKIDISQHFSVNVEKLLTFVLIAIYDEVARSRVIKN